MKKLLQTLLFFIFIAGTAYSQVANCDCTNCPVAITDNGNFNGNIFVQNTGPNILGVNNCLSQVCFTVAHPWIGDLDFILTAPDGTTYIIMGDMDNDAAGCGTDCDNLNVCITLGTGNPAGTGATEYGSLPGGAGNCVAGNFTVATGVTNPNGPGVAAPGGNLSAFNNGTGTVSGMWTLTIGDNCALDEGFLTNWSMSFCDESGINCSSTPLCIMNSINANIGPCIPATGNYNTSGSISFSNPPAAGTLIVQNCNGTQQIFNPPFVSPINYSLDAPADGGVCSVTATFTAAAGCTISTGNFAEPTCPCIVNNFTANISACNAATNTYDITGQVQFTSPPAGGQMIVENCDGVQQVFNPPFVSPTNYTLTGCVPNGTACDVQVYFTANPVCQQTINFVEPQPCNCSADAGTYSANIVGVSANNYVLCWGDQININSNNDFTYPGNVSDPVIPYNPGIFYMIYSCPPTPGIDIVTDPCLLGVIGTTQNFNDLNDLTVVNSFPPGTFVNNTVYYVPITMYDTVGYYYSVTDYAGTCFDLGTPFAVTYLPEITYTSTENCNTGQATFTINGGHPDVFGTNFTASGLIPATASFGNTTCGDGGTITINGLQDGDNYSFTITDANGCPITCTGGPFVAASDATITPAGPFCPGDPAFQMTAVDPGGTWTATCGGCITVGGMFNPAAAGAGNHTVTYTIPGVCGDIANTIVTVNPALNATINAQPAVCINAPAVIFTAATAGGTWSATCGGCINPVTGSIDPATAGSGIHTITYTLAGACGSVDNENFTVNALPNAIANNNGPLCENQNLNLTSAGGVDYDWTGPNAYIQNNTQNPTIVSATLAAGGIYTVTVTDANGCINTATTNVVMNSNLVFNANSNSPICAGAQLDLTADNIPTATYDWVGPNAYVQNNVQNPSIPGATVAATGIYTVTATNAAGCTGTATTNVTVNALPAPVANSNSPICSGTALNLTSNGGADYDWIGPNAYVANNTQNPTINPATVLETGVYTVTVTDINNCSATATANVIVNALPNAVAGNTGPVCEGINVDLTSNGGTGYAWVGPGGYNSILQNPTLVAANPGQSGTYTVTVTDANTCTATATTNLIVNALPLVLANTNAPLCDGEDIILNANGAFNYTWVGPNGFNQNGQSPVINNITIAGNGVYTVTGTDANGCTNTATINVTSFRLPTAQFVGDRLEGCSPLCVNFTDQSNGNGGVINQWTWNIEGEAPIATQNSAVCFPNPGTYNVGLTVTTADGCVGTVTINNYITVHPNPVAEFIYTPQEIIESDPQVTFASTSINAVSWLWDFGDGSTDNVENPIHHYQDTGVFCIDLIVATNFGCTDTTTGCLHVKPEYSLFIPNTFTVNEDGLNEIWQIYGRGVKSLVARIFDRWGEEIYLFDDINKGWPGTKQNGTECKQDVYVYRVEVMDAKGDPHTYIGNVNLIR